MPPQDIPRATNWEDLLNTVAEKRPKFFTSPRVKPSLLAIDRANYVGEEEAYVDNPVSIGMKATISAPHMHAFAISTLEPFLHPGARVLDVGCGSGYLTACIARVVSGTNETTGENGYVVGIDYVPELVELAEANCRKKDGDLLDSGAVKFVVGDGWKGVAEFGPYDAIHVGAAANSIPHELIAQLKPKGRLLTPLGPYNEMQSLLQVDKVDGVASETYLIRGGVRYVPLLKEAEKCLPYARGSTEDYRAFLTTHCKE